MQFFNKIKKQIQQMTEWNRFVKGVRPMHDFAAKASPSKPDYSNLFNWFAHPQIESKVHFTPEGVEGADAWKAGEVDVFLFIQR